MKAASARHRLPLVGIAVIALLVAGAVLLGVWRPWIPTPSIAPAMAATEQGAPAIAPAPLVLPDHPRVLVFGDSWTYGSAASVPTSGYAYLLADVLDADTIVDGVRGSGYLKPGLDGPTFGERIVAIDPTLDPDLIIIQGSINDRAEAAAGYRDAVTAAWDAMAATYPAATIVVLGPAPHELPVAKETVRIDRDLAALTSARGWWYISPVTDNWITPENYLSVIDVDAGRKHPSSVGHQYLAEKVAAALMIATAAPMTVAGESETTSEQ